jgi:hypothetical protein
VNWSWRTEEPDFQARRVNSGMSCTETTSVVVGLLIVFLETVSLEFSAERFLVSCAIETLIDKWIIPWFILDKRMAHPLGIPDKRMAHSLG